MDFLMNGAELVDIIVRYNLTEGVGSKTFDARFYYRKAQVKEVLLNICHPLEVEGILNFIYTPDVLGDVLAERMFNAWYG